MSTIRFSKVYNRKNRLNLNKEALIQIKAYHSKVRNGSNTRYFSTGVYIAPENWNSRDQSVKNHPLDFQYNFKINKLLQELNLKYTDIFRRNGRCSLEDLNRDQDSSYLSFLEFAINEIESSTKKASTKTAQKNTLTKLIGYRQHVYFNDLTYSFISNFDNFLVKSGLGTTTIAKHHKDLKFLINEAIRKDLFKSSENPYIKFKVKRGIPKSRNFLEIYEIETLRNLQFPTQEIYLDRIKDMFLFGVYTGLRFSDLNKLKLANFIETPKGIILKVKAQKTDKEIDFPLWLLFKSVSKDSYPEQLYFKYKTLVKEIHGRNYMDVPIFGGLTNQHCNRELKEIAKRAQIDKVLSTHVARTSFGTNMATKVPMSTLQHLMQHSKISTTQIYIKLSKNLIHKSLENVDWS